MTFIKSQMGTGKTKALIDILIYASAVYDKVIFVSFRRSFTKEITRRLSHANFVSYMNVEGKITDARVIVQFESICRIDMTPPEGAGSMHTLVILDEAKSIVGQAVLASQTRSMESQYGAFRGILVSARHILLMDAFLDDTTINLYSGIVNTKDIIIHVNNYPVWSDRKVIHIPNTVRWHYMLIKSLKNGYKCAIPVTFQSRAHNIKDIITSILGEDFPCVIYTGRSSAKVKDVVFTDVHAAWKNAMAIIYTSTLLAGVSYEEPIDFVFAHIKCNPFVTIKAEDVIQMIGRFRSVREIYMYISTDRNIMSHEMCAVERGDSFDPADCISKRFAFLEANTVMKSKYDYIGRIQEIVNEMGCVVVTDSSHKSNSARTSIALDRASPLRLARLERIAAAQKWSSEQVVKALVYTNSLDSYPEITDVYARAEICRHYNIEYTADLTPEWLYKYMDTGMKMRYNCLSDYFGADAPCPYCSDAVHLGFICRTKVLCRLLILIGFDNFSDLALKSINDIKHHMTINNDAIRNLLSSINVSMSPEGIDSLFGAISKVLVEMTGFEIKGDEDGIYLVPPISDFHFASDDIIYTNLCDGRPVVSICGSCEFKGGNV